MTYKASLRSNMHNALQHQSQRKKYLDAGGSNNQLKHSVISEWLRQACKKLPVLWHSMQAILQMFGKVCHEGLQQVCCKSLC